MNTYAKLAIAAAAVVVVAVIGINLLPASGGIGGQPAVSPSPSPRRRRHPVFWRPPSRCLSARGHLDTGNGTPSPSRAFL